MSRNYYKTKNDYFTIQQGRGQVFIGGGAQLGPFKFVKKFSAKIDKTSLNFKKVLQGFKVNFQLCSNKKFLIFKIFLFKTKIDLCLKFFEKNRR